MAKPTPACTIRVSFRSGKCYRIDLIPRYLYRARRTFTIRFTDDSGESREGSGTISRLLDRLRRLLVDELRN